MEIPMPQKPTMLQSSYDSLTIAWEIVSATSEFKTIYTLQHKHHIEGWLTVYSYAFFIKRLERGYCTRKKISNLGPGRCYFFRLKIKTVEGESIWSPVLAACTKDGCIPTISLHKAIQNSKHQVIRKILLSRKDARDIPNHNGTSPLILAALKGDKDIVEMLLRQGVDVNGSGDGSGRTAIMIAAYQGLLELVVYLTEQGASWDVKDKSGCSAVHYAVDGSRLEVLKWAIQHKLNINITDNYSWNPLMRGVMLGTSPLVLQELLNHGIDANSMDSRGQTCLMQAVLTGNSEVVRLLLRHGSNPTIRNKYSHSAIDMAQAQEKKEILELLEEYSGKSPNEMHEAKHH